MAASTVTRYHESSGEQHQDVVQLSSVTCPPSSFPDKFQDFFAALTEDTDDLPSMLEDKLIPRKLESPDGKKNGRKWTKRAFQRRSSEVEVRLHQSSQSGGSQLNAEGPKSPNPSRRRSSSIAVARPTPDLHRFLQAEAGPWGHLSPSPRSPTRSSILSPGSFSMTPHLSPSPTSPAGPGITPRNVQRPERQHRGRTSSMPAVPRHRMEKRNGGFSGC